MRCLLTKMLKLLFWYTGASTMDVYGQKSSILEYRSVYCGGLWTQFLYFTL